MNAKQQLVGALFETSIRLRAPLFQRPYVWTIANWEPLWESIRDVADRLLDGRSLRPHFLGAVVLEQEFVPVGGIGNVRLIIDGQQRLTTLQILLAVLRDTAENAHETHEKGSFTRLIDNHTTNPLERFKVAPTTDDLQAFTEVMTAGSPTVVKKKFGSASDSLLAHCYLYFHDEMATWLKTGDVPERLAALRQVFHGYLALVAIELDGKEDDAQEIFETLNTRGEPLLPADLVKNYLLRAAEMAGMSAVELRSLYERYWREFDRGAVYWRQRVRQGRLFAPRMNGFLQHYLVLKKKDEVLATNLFGDFRIVAKGRSVEEMLKDLRAYADAYRRMEQPAVGSVEYGPLNRIRELDVTTFDPIVLESLHRRSVGLFTDDDVSRILTDLESYLVRRSVYGLSTKGYNKTAADLVRTLADDWSADGVQEFFLQQMSETTVWPTDEDFGRAWSSMPMYKGRRARVRMLLESFERKLRTSRGEKLEFGEKLTVEHLLPQKWTKTWPLPPGGDERRRERLLHTIGNLTLLTRVLNPDVSNGPWRVKLAKILQHSALNLNRELQQFAEWNEDLIEQRSGKLFKLALEMWPRPQDDRAEDVLVATPAREEPQPTADIHDERVISRLQRIAEVHGTIAAEAVRGILQRVAEVGVRIRPGRSSVKARLALAGQTQRLSLFFIDTDGRVKFGWMRTSQLAEIGLPEDFADDYYTKVAERFGVELKKHVPDGLTVAHLSSDADTFAELTVEFIDRVRAALPANAEVPDADDDEDGEGDES